MSGLIDIIKQDLKNVSRLVVPSLAGAVVGTVRGVYTPFLLNTGIRQIRESINETGPEKTTQNTYAGATIIFQSSIAGLLFGKALIYTFLEENKGWEYLGVLAATNTVDYLFNAYRRSKKEKIEQ